MFVTHDQDEALSLSDAVILMRGGEIEQSGSPEDLYDRPATAFVADFMGASNVIDATVSDGRVTALGGAIDLPADALPAGTVKLAIRQEHLRPVARGDAPDGLIVIPADRQTRVFLGSRARYRFRAGGTLLHALVPGDAIATADKADALAIDPARLVGLRG